MVRTKLGEERPTRWTSMSLLRQGIGLPMRSRRPARPESVASRVRGAVRSAAARTPPWRQLLPNLGWFCLGLTACALTVSLGIRLFGPAPFLGQTTDKLEHYRSLPAVPDLVLVGSSHIHWNFEPAVLEDELARCGLPMTVYNLGRPGAHAVEQRYIVDQIAADRRGRPAMIVLDEAVPAYILRHPVLTDRNIYFSYAWHLMLHLRDLATTFESLQGKVLRGLRLAYAYAYAHLGLGQLQRVLVRADRPAERNYSTGFLDRAGYLAMEDDIGTEVMHEEFLAERDALFARRRAFLKEAPAGPLDRLRAAELASRLRHVQDHGMEAVFVEVPRLQAKKKVILDMMRQAAPFGHVVDFDDMHRYPEFFVPSLWYDKGHLTRAGSALLSRRFAQVLCRSQGKTSDTALG